MNDSLFASPAIVLSALLVGMFFGFLLRKGAVSRFDTIVGQLLLKDFTVMKVMFTAIVAGSIGIYFLNAYDAIPLFHLSKTSLIGSAIGGLIFGVGMSITGYCPGTAIAALAEGASDMIFGVLGMFVGAALFNELSKNFGNFFKAKDAFYQESFISFFNFPVWTILSALLLVWLCFVLVIKLFEKKKV